MDIFQSRLQSIGSVAEIHDVDIPRTTGIVQMNTYHQNVLGPVQRIAAGLGSNATVSLVGHLAGYLGTICATDTNVFPTSRMSLDLHMPQAADVAGQAVAVRTPEQGMAPLLPANSPARQWAQEGDWGRLTDWRNAAPNAEVKSTSARDLTARTGLQGSSEHYRASFPPMRVPGRRACEAPPRVLNRARSSFVDSSDYSWSADPRVACGERPEDTAVKPVTDVLSGFSATVAAPFQTR